MDNRITKGRRLVGLALTTALASGALAGCTGDRAPEARVSAGKAGEALEKGRVSAAVRHAEAAVLAQPRVAEHRVTLGAAYLQAGRFQSAEASFAEAMELGEQSSRVVVSRALALVAVGKAEQAHELLARNADDIDAADLGLAYALTGDAERGAAILATELRSGQNTPKVRQNLAYAAALNGDWRTARLLVSEDVPADKVGDRLGGWAATAGPDAQTLRVANLLGVEIARADARPAELALANFPSTPMLAAEAAASQPMDVAPSIAVATTDTGGELPAVSATTSLAALDQPRRAPITIVLPAESKPVAKPAVAATAPVRLASAKPAASVPAKPAARQLEAGNHLVQLGSYLSEADARRAWGVFQSRFAMLKGTAPVITRAEVKGRTYFRVAAGNLAEGSARSLCSTVKASGGGCFAYSGARPLPGTVGGQVRVASR